MAVLYIVSTEPYSGKTGICLSLGLELKQRGYKVGYMKPIGTVPGRIDSRTVDLDAYHVLQRLDTGDHIEDVSPISLTRQFIHAHLRGEQQDSMHVIQAAFDRISKDKDVVLLENGADVNEGRFIGASAYQIAHTLHSKTLLVAKFRSELVIDDILEAKDLLGEDFLGVVFNQVPRSERAVMEMMVPYLTRHGINVYGALPQDRTLMAVTVGEIAQHLNGTVLTATNMTDELVENIMVGAMGQEKALRFFQRTSNKAVITGGDRSDVQLAALETPTKALILTGSLQPSPIVMARAEELGVPMVLVDLDTLQAVEKTDELVGRVRIHQKEKVDRFHTLVRNGINLERLFADAGIAK
ncbi:MAG TPA: phosphotransacetylase family protein [Candidatus Aquicultor sp.]|jgi:hypothetical protein